MLIQVLGMSPALMLHSGRGVWKIIVNYRRLPAPPPSFVQFIQETKTLTAVLVC